MLKVLPKPYTKNRGAVSSHCYCTTVANQADDRISYLNKKNALQRDNFNKEQKNKRANPDVLWEQGVPALP